MVLLAIFALSLRTLRSQSSRRLHDTLTKEIIGAAMKVHRKLGPGVLESAYEAQLLSHLRLLNLPLGLLINFRVVLLKDGVKRMVSNYLEPVEVNSF
jgi:PD-(D/E)XK nuclease superfamily